MPLQQVVTPSPSALTPRAWLSTPSQQATKQERRPMIALLSVMARSNNVTGENSVAVGANNGTVAGGQSAVVGYNNKIGTQKEQLVFGSNSETTGQGALVFGTHAKALATDALAFGNNTIADKANAVAIGTNAVTDDAVGVDGITINGTRHVFAGEQPASVVSFGSKARAGAGGVTQYNRQLTKGVSQLQKIVLWAQLMILTTN